MDAASLHRSVRAPVTLRAGDGGPHGEERKDGAVSALQPTAARLEGADAETQARPPAATPPERPQRICPTRFSRVVRCAVIVTGTGVARSGAPLLLASAKLPSTS